MILIKFLKKIHDFYLPKRNRNSFCLFISKNKDDIAKEINSLNYNDIQKKQENYGKLRR